MITINVPAIPVVVLGFNLKTPELNIPLDIAARVLDVMSKNDFESRLRSCTYLCNAVGQKDFGILVTDQMGAFTLNAFFEKQNSAVSDDLTFELPDMLDARLTWARHIKHTLRVSLMKE